MTTRSGAWVTYVEHLREVAQLLRADPASRYGKSGTTLGVSSTADGYLSAGSCRGALVLTCSYLQGYVGSAVQEFLERVDASALDVALLPRDLRAELCLRFPYPAHVKEAPDQTELVHRSYAVLWQDGATLPPGTLRTGSLVDPSANPWPNSVATLLKLLDVDVYAQLRDLGGVPWVAGVKDNVKELVMSRNKVAHGDDSVAVTADDVRRLMQWATRLARSADLALANKLVELTAAGW